MEWSGGAYSGKALAHPETLDGWKGLPGINVPAYYRNQFITGVIFITVGLKSLNVGRSKLGRLFLASLSGLIVAKS
jgi:hypothetical protein